MKPAIGDFVDRFKITGEIGSGGMGYVFSAVDPELQRLVAVKILQLSGYNSADQIERFKREGRVLSLLQHPNIVRVYATGIWQQNYPYLVMELLHGESLASLIARNGALPEREALSMLMDISAALQVVHSHNVIHRDLKPHNIFLAKQDNTVTIKLLDFGLCRIDTVAEHLTATGLLLGSPHYLSPEVCTGARSCPQSDIYALGIILYEMLCGSPPFTSDNYVGVIYKHANQTAEPLSVICPQLNRVTEIDRIISKCLAKKPADRYKTAEDLIKDIAELMERLACPDNGEPMALTPAAASGNQNSIRFTLITVALLLLAIIPVTMHQERFSPPRQKFGADTSVHSKSSVLRTVNQLTESLQKLEKLTDMNSPDTIGKALNLIDSWAIRRKGTISEAEAAQSTLLRGKWLLRSANRSDASQGEELLTKLLTRAERRQDDLTELEIRSLLTSYYNKTEQVDKLRSVSQRIYQLWSAHSSEKEFFWAARGLRTRALAGPWIVPNSAEEEKERLKGLAFDKTALETFEEGSLVVTGFYREDLFELIEFYLQHDNIDEADRFFVQLESTFQTRETADLKKLQPRMSLLKARIALAKGSARQALSGTKEH